MSCGLTDVESTGRRQGFTNEEIEERLTDITARQAAGEPLCERDYIFLAFSNQTCHACSPVKIQVR